MAVYFGNQRVSLFGGTAPVSYLGTITSAVEIEHLPYTDQVFVEPVGVDDIPINEQLALSVYSTGDVNKFTSLDGSATGNILCSYPELLHSTYAGLTQSAEITTSNTTKEILVDGVISSIEVDARVFYTVDDIEIIETEV
ncbi:hypothetical protein M2140_000169 [Clostridiales Family XIII bacterium PM5-7]